MDIRIYARVEPEELDNLNLHFEDNLCRLPCDELIVIFGVISAFRMLGLGIHDCRNASKWIYNVRRGTGGCC